jgi:hypothetical protein
MEGCKCNKERAYRGAGWKDGMWQGSRRVEEM